MSCKIDAVIRKYDLGVSQPGYDGINAYLLQRWTGRDEKPSEGYRSLTEWFNKRLLKHIYDEHNRETTGIRIESEYETLQSGDELTKQELKDDLRATGIDVEAVESSLVSWSTMRHHLNDCLDGTKAPAEATSEWEIESVRIASKRTEEKASEALRSLVAKGEITDGKDADITVDIQLSCSECHVRTPFSDAVKRGYICQEHAPDTHE